MHLAEAWNVPRMNKSSARGCLSLFCGRHLCSLPPAFVVYHFNSQYYRLVPSFQLFLLKRGQVLNCRRLSLSLWSSARLPGAASWSSTWANLLFQDCCHSIAFGLRGCLLFNLIIISISKIFNDHGRLTLGTRSIIYCTSRYSSSMCAEHYNRDKLRIWEWSTTMVALLIWIQTYTI